MSQNNIVSPENFQYTQSNNLTNLQNLYLPPSNCLQSLILEMRDEIRSLKTDMKDLKNENKTKFAKLTEEVIAVKLENRRHNNVITFSELEEEKSFPFKSLKDFQEFDEQLEKNPEKLDQFKKFIAKTGGEGYTQFLRAAVRKIFSDELASAYSWNGTNTKPSAEKCYAVTIIKNICHVKYKTLDKELNAMLQKHFVHATDRVNKRKRVA